MKTRITTFLSLVAPLCLYAFSATATGAGGNRVVITDPAVLESMGLPRDATNVYQLVNPGTAATSGAEAADFGTGSNFTALAAKSYIGRQSTAAAPWEYSGGDVGCCQNISRKGTEDFADAQVNVPNGALITGFRYWANDTNAAFDMSFFLMENCHPGFSEGATVITTLGSMNTTGSAGYQGDFLALSATADNTNCTYISRVRFDATTGQTLQKVRVQWQRQISPAPLVATFGDVPTTHPFFREIEALAASGVTLGCGGGNYCPALDIPRDQMAAFLARALGL